MKLLILGLILIGILIMKLYYINKEGFVDETNLNLEKKIDDEKKTIKNQARNYIIKSSPPGEEKIKSGIEFVKPKREKVIEGYGSRLLLDVVPSGNQILKTKEDKEIEMCNIITDCKDLPDKDPTGNGCGYCAINELDEVPATGQGFSFGDKNNTLDDISCKKGQWVRNKTKCQYLSAKQQCAKVKSCGDLIGGLEEICGWCPTRGISLPKNPGSETLMFPNEDICPSSGQFEGGKLLTSQKCGAFLDEHPCITPYHQSGPHSGKCVKKLWELSGCKPKGLKNQGAEKGINIDDYVEKLGDQYGSHPNIKSYQQLGKDFQSTEKLINNNTYSIAKGASDYCLGDSSKLNSCDSKYNTNGNPDIECLKKKYLESGCTKEGTGWKNLNRGEIAKKNHIEDINTFNKNQYEEDTEGNITYRKGNNTTTSEAYLENLLSLESLTVNAEDYSTRLKTSKICYGKIPPPPPGIKKGDAVYRIINNENYEGIATDVRIKDGRKAALVMWYKKTHQTTKVIQERKNQTDIEKMYFGWPGIAPTHNKMLVDKDGWINLKKLKLKESCSGNTSSCKETCKDKVRNILLKYPPPLDCVQTDWTNWSNCSKSCNSKYPNIDGAGTQTRTRNVIFKAQYGGKSCGPARKTQKCNNIVCLDTATFKDLDMPPLRQGFKNIKEGLKGKCEGDCNSNRDCKSGLVCFQRNGNERVPGCKNKRVGKSGWDYCVDKNSLKEKTPPGPPAWVKGQRYGYRGKNYRGKRNWTTTGRDCQKWTNQSPHRHSREPYPKKCISGRYSINRPCKGWISRWGWCGWSSAYRKGGTKCYGGRYQNKGTDGAGNNYCRNPDNEPGGIWCYTTDKRKRWEHCK